MKNMINVISTDQFKYVELETFSTFYDDYLTKNLKSIIDDIYFVDFESWSGI